MPYRRRSMTSFNADFEIERPDPSLMEDNPFLDGKPCLAILTSDNKVRLIPPDEFVAKFWRDAFTKRSPELDRLRRPKQNEHLEHRYEPEHRLEPRVAVPKRSTPRRSPRGRPTEEGSDDDDPRDHRRRPLRTPSPEPDQFRRPKQTVPGRRSKPQKVAPIQSAPQRRPREEGPDDEDLFDCRRLTSPPCARCPDKLTARDLSAICGISEIQALEAIRCVNDNGDDCLDSTDFELLKQHCGFNMDRSTRSIPEEENVSRPKRRYRQRDRPMIQEREDVPARQSRSGSVDKSARADRTRTSSQAQAERVEMFRQGRTDQTLPDNVRDKVAWAIRSEREEMLLHGKGQKYRVDVILGDHNVSIGDQQLAYSQISEVIASKNTCLAILTPSGKLVLQCRNRDIRDHWQAALENRSQTPSMFLTLDPNNVG